MTSAGPWRWLARTELWIYLVATAITAVLTTLALQLWKADLSVPLTYRGDALPVGAHFKTVLEEGWYEHQPRLGAPYGQFYNDFPTADNLHLVAAKILGLFTSDWVTALNTYFLVGFILISLAAVWFLRKCGISPWLSIALATLYSLASFHFLRGESHLFLASYYAIPLAMGLIVFVLRGEPLWALGTRGGRLLRVVLSPAARTVLIVAILGTSSSYYSVFFLVLLAPVGLLVLVRDKSWRRFWGAAAAGLATVVVMLLNMLPDILFSLAHGQNPLGLDRSPGEAEFYALKLSQLLLPWGGHRITALATLRQKYDAGYVVVGEQTALGAIAAVGLIAAFLVVAYLAVSRVSRSTVPVAGGRFELVAGLSTTVLVAFLFSTLGGLSTIVSIFTSSIRGWNRMSIVISMLCLAIVGILIQMALERLARRRALSRAAQTGIAVLVAAALLVVGYVDQTPGDSDREYAGNSAQFASDEAYFSAIQKSLPSGSMVLMLPYIPFPESQSPNGQLASEQLVPYLHTSTVRWSNGGIKGRPEADWPGELAQYGDANAAFLGAAAGFSGLLVDRSAAADGAASLEAAVAAATGSAPVVDAGGRFAYFDLSRLADQLKADHDADWFTKAAAEITNPVIAYRTPGFDEIPGGVSLEARSSTDSFTIANATDEARSARLEFTVESPDNTAVARVTLPDGSVTTVPLADGGDVSILLTVEPGSHPVTVSLSNADGSPAASLVITRPSLRNTDIASLLAVVD